MHGRIGVMGLLESGRGRPLQDLVLDGQVLNLVLGLTVNTTVGLSPCVCSDMV